MLMKRANSGDKAAYSLLLESLSVVVRKIISKKIRAADEAEDVLQEILISIHKARHTYDGSRPLLPWVYAIAKFRLADHFRKTYGRVETINIEEVAEIADENVTEPAAFYESIKKEVEKLSGNQPKILELMYVNGLTAKEAGQKLGMKESAVKVAAHRAYKILRKKLSV